MRALTGSRRVIGRGVRGALRALSAGIRATAEPAAIGQAVGHGGMYGSVPPSIAGAMMAGAGRRIGNAAAGGTPAPRLTELWLPLAAAAVLILGISILGATTPQPLGTPEQRSLAQAVANAPAPGWSFLALNAAGLFGAERICAFAPNAGSPQIDAALGFHWDRFTETGARANGTQDLVIAATADRVVTWTAVPAGRGVALIVSPSGCDTRP